MIQVIYQSLPPKEAALLSGIVAGDKTGFEYNFLNDLKDSGVMHVIVVSGTNIMILARFLIENTAKFWGRKTAIIFGLVLIWAYVLAVGMEAPVIRAVLLISFWYWAQLLGRKFSIKRSLVLIVLIMIIADYQIATGLSFWLSFSTFLAMLIKPKYKGNFLTEEIFSTLWISLWTSPILAYTVGKISLVGFVSNTLILGVIELITIIGGLGTIVGILWFRLGQIILILIWPILKYFIVVTESLGKVPWASVSIKFNLCFIFGCYLIMGVWYLKHHED
jgi:competence protein ComEC